MHLVEYVAVDHDVLYSIALIGFTIKRIIQTYRLRRPEATI